MRQLTFRNDSGSWNSHPEKYPDGVYWGIDYRDGQRSWNIDIWFVADADRQPDLRHVEQLGRRLTAETRSAILDIKRAWVNRPEYGQTVTSFDIYTAVLDRRHPDAGGVRARLTRGATMANLVLPSVPPVDSWVSKIWTLAVAGRADPASGRGVASEKNQVRAEVAALEQALEVGAAPRADGERHARADDPQHLSRSPRRTDRAERARTCSSSTANRTTPVRNGR